MSLWGPQPATGLGPPGSSPHPGDPTTAPGPLWDLAEGSCAPVPLSPSWCWAARHPHSSLVRRELLRNRGAAQGSLLELPGENTSFRCSSVLMRLMHKHFMHVFRMAAWEGLSLEGRNAVPSHASRRVPRGPRSPAGLPAPGLLSSSPLPAAWPAPSPDGTFWHCLMSKTPSVISESARGGFLSFLAVLPLKIFCSSFSAPCYSYVARGLACFT